MSKPKRFKLSEMSKSELQAREMNKLLGGENCCICSCPGFDTSGTTGADQNRSGGVHEGGGYGSRFYG